ncbi:MAG: hypothetical protein Q9209_006221 [Squamulea sp. 1 TL-2023]
MTLVITPLLSGKLRAAWGKDYGISATLAPGIYLQGFDPKRMEPHVDFFNFLSYDLPAPFGAVITARPHTDIREMEKKIAALWTDKSDPQKVNMALRNFSRGYTLYDSKCTHAGGKVSRPSKPGPCTGQAGILSKIEIDDIVKQRHLKAQLVPGSIRKEITRDDQWIGFDNPETMALKPNRAAENCLGGTMLWSVDMNSGEGSGPGPMPVIPLVPAPTVPGKSTSLAPGQTTAAALIVPGFATVPSSTISSGAMVTEGAGAVLGLVPVAVAIQKGLLEGQKAITNLVQSKVPKSTDVVATLGTLAVVYASQQLLNKEAAMLKIGSLPKDAKKAIESVEKTLPKIQDEAKEAIRYLTDSITNPVAVNRDDLHKANGLLGQQASITKQIAPSLEQLANWKPPKGSNDVTLPGILSLPSPSLGDNWKGTTIPDILTVPSPTVRWDKALLIASNTPISPDTGGSSEGGGSRGGNGGGGGDDGNGGATGGSLLLGLLRLAKQAKDAMNSLASAVAGLSGKCQRDLDSCPISFPNRISDLDSQLTSATEDVGGLGAGLDAIELDLWSPADINRVVRVQNANRNLFNILKNNLNELARVINNPPQALQVLERQSPKYVAGGAVLVLLSQSNGGSIGALPLAANVAEKEKLKDERFLVGVPNTPAKVFQDFIKTYPTKGWISARMMRTLDPPASDRQFDYLYEQNLGRVDHYGDPSGFNKIPVPALDAQGRDLRLTGHISVYALEEDVGIIDIHAGDGYVEASAPKESHCRREADGPKSRDGINIAYNGIEVLQHWCLTPTITRRPQKRYIDAATVLDLIAKVLRRQRNGHLTDAKYSDQNDKDIQLYLLVVTSASSKGKDCLDGFYLAMNNCDPEAPDKRFGNMGDVHYYVYANKTVAQLTSTSKPPPAPSPPPAPPKDVRFPTPNEIACNAPSPRPEYSRFEVLDMCSAIQSTCNPENKDWNTSVVSIAENGKTNLNLSSVDLKAYTHRPRNSAAMVSTPFSTPVSTCSTRSNPLPQFSPTNTLSFSPSQGEKDKPLHYGGQADINSIRIFPLYQPRP